MIDHLSLSAQPAIPPAGRRRGGPDSARVYLQQFSALSLMSRYPAPMLSFNNAGIIGYANQAFAGMLGYPDPGQLRGVAMNEIAGPESRCTLAVHQIELLGYQAGTTTTWTHRHGHSVITVVSPTMHLRIFDPVAVVFFTEVSA